jgi:glycosyltransferase involved in cell wall biosynthesis
MTRQWIVSQIGSREHYAVPRAFQLSGAFELLITDYWCRRGRRLLASGPVGLRALAGRWSPSIPSEKVVSFNLATLIGRVRSARAGVDSVAVSRDYVRVGREFGIASAKVLEQRSLSPQRHAFFAYCTGALEALQLLAGRGIPTVVDQIDPARAQEKIVRAEQRKWPGWESGAEMVAEEYWQRLEAEWRTASAVLVNSAWSKSALVAQGVPAEKIIVVPLAYEVERSPARTVSRSGPLSVLWLGTVGLRKGIQYLVEAARMLQNDRIHITIAGPIGITPEAVAAAPSNVTFIGRVTRDRLSEVYSGADVFAFPTLADGFGLTQLEAMAHGLPVIATPCCGAVVQDGVNGFIVPHSDAAALAAAILQLARDRDLLAAMSVQATRRAGEFSLKRYFEELHDQLRGVGVFSLEEAAGQGAVTCRV